MKKFLAIVFAVLMLLPAVPVQKTDAAKVSYQLITCEVTDLNETPKRQKVGDYYYWAMRGMTAISIHASKTKNGSGTYLAILDGSKWDLEVNLITNGSWVYYAKQNNRNNPQIMRVNSYGKNQKAVYTYRSTSSGLTLESYYGGRIYFHVDDTTRSSNYLCSVTTSGKDAKRNAKAIYVTDAYGRYIYITRNNDYIFNHYVFDCKQGKVIRKLAASPVVVGKTLYMRENTGSYDESAPLAPVKRRLWACALNGSDKKTVATGYGTMEFYYKQNGTLSNYVFYCKSEKDFQNGIYTGYNMKTGKTVKLGTYDELREKLG